MTTIPPAEPEDPRSAGRDLLARMIADIKSQLNSAPPAERNRLILKWFPILSKQLEDEKVDDATQKMRDELDAYRDDVARALLGRFADEVNSDPDAQPSPTDLPPEDAAQ